MKAEKRNYSNVTRYGTIHTEDDEGPYSHFGKDTIGEYVLYSDYMSLLDEKSPERQLSSNDLAQMIKDKIKHLQKLCDDTFLKKDEINYGWAVDQRKQANTLLQAASILNIKLQ